MTRKLAMLTALALLMASTAALANDGEIMDAERTESDPITSEFQEVFRLSSLFASETACGLTYDKDAVESLIVKNANASRDKDMYVPDLMMHADNAKIDMEKMPAAMLKGHCVQVRRLAKRYGFIK